MKITVLVLYLSTFSAQSGMTVTTAEFWSPEACEAAGRSAQRSFGGMATNVRFICVDKGQPSERIPSVPTR